MKTQHLNMIGGAAGLGKFIRFSRDCCRLGLFNLAHCVVASTTNSWNMNFLKVRFQHALFNGSMFGIVHINAKLPQYVVDYVSVFVFILQDPSCVSTV